MSELCAAGMMAFCTAIAPPTGITAGADPAGQASGITAPRWGFEGFLPRKGRERRERLARIAADERATVIYEAHGRTAATLADPQEPADPAALQHSPSQRHTVPGPL